MALYVKFSTLGKEETTNISLVEKPGYYKVTKIIVMSDLVTVLMKLVDRWVEVPFAAENAKVLANSGIASGINFYKEVPL